MTRIYTEGFEHSGMNWVNGYANSWVVTTSPRSGVYGLRCGDGTSGYAYHVFSGISEGYFRVCHYRAIDLTSGLRIFRWDGAGGELGSIRWNAGKILLYLGSGTYLGQSSLTLSANTWYTYEVHVKISDTVGLIEVKIDGVLDISYSGDTKPGSDTTMSVIYLWGSNNYNYFDDLALNDTNGSTDNSWCGDGRIIKLLPISDGDVSQLVPLSGSAHYSMVDDLGDSNYVSGSVVGEYDLYNLANFPYTGKTINRVWIQGYCLDNAGTGGYISYGVKTGGSESWSGSIPQIMSYTWTSGSVYAINPISGSPWTKSDIDDLQIGVKIENITP